MGCDKYIYMCKNFFLLYNLVCNIWNYTKEETHGKDIWIRACQHQGTERRQMIALSQIKVSKENIYMDKQSGKDFGRPKYQHLLKKLGEGDLLYVKSIDRLGRNYEEILEQWRFITKDKKADIAVLDMPLLDTRIGKDLMGTFLSDIVLQVLSFVAENERGNIRQRQKEGIEAAKQRGVKFGRPAKPLPENFGRVYKRWVRQEINVVQAAEMCQMSVPTFYRRAESYEKSVKNHNQSP